MAWSLCEKCYVISRKEYAFNKLYLHFTVYTVIARFFQPLETICCDVSRVNLHIDDVIEQRNHLFYERILFTIYAISKTIDKLCMSCEIRLLLLFILCSVSGVMYSKNHYCVCWNRIWNENAVKFFVKQNN